jgi:hypothetical protein
MYSFKKKIIIPQTTAKIKNSFIAGDICSDVTMSIPLIFLLSQPTTGRKIIDTTAIPETIFEINFGLEKWLL